MPAAVSVVGAALVVVVLVDVFQTLWHPRGQGRLSGVVMAAVWWSASRRHPPSPLTGPLAMLLVVGGWAALTVVGWLVVYAPHMPEAFSFSPGLDPGGRSSILESATLSLVTVGTLGFGDVVPSTGWLRLVVPLEALVGFVLLTASISWTLQIQPVLGRRRALGARLSVIEEASPAPEAATLDSSAVAVLLDEIAASLLQVGSDLSHHAITYYFRDSDHRLSLPGSVHVAWRLAAAGSRSSRADVRTSAHRLQLSLDALADVLQPFVGGSAQPQESLRRWAVAHGHRGDLI
jgi:hypothetical protein